MSLRAVRDAAAGLAVALRGSATLVANSGAMAVGTTAAAVLGLLYWWLAAHSFAPAAIGKASALLSVMALIGILGEAGLGTLLVGELTVRRDRAPGLVAATALMGAGLGVALGLAFACATRGTGDGTGEGWLAFSVFVAGCALTAPHMIGLQALVGGLNGGGRMVEQVLFSVSKLLLIASAVGAGLSSETAIVASWPLGILVSWILFDVMSGGAARRLVGRPDFRLLHDLRRKVVGHYALDIAVQGPGVALPYVVLVMLSPDKNAPFATLWMLLSTAAAIPAVAATALFPVVRADPTRYRHDLAVSLGMSLLFSLVCAAAVTTYWREMLGFFNPAYPDIAGPGLRFLGFGLFGLTMKFHLCALARLGNWMGRASGWFAVGAVAEIAAAAAGARIDGLHGLVVGWTAAVSLEGAIAAAVLAVGARIDAADRERADTSRLAAAIARGSRP